MSTPVGPYTPIVAAGPWLVCSGQLGLAATPPGRPPALVEGGTVAQLTRALANAAGLLAEQGATTDDVVKTTVFVTDMDDYPAVNEAYAAFFDGHRPARTVVGVSALPLGASVEVELWAYRDG
jgi:2-iminobutanoate/2-iminopropanoate deaminase